MANILVYALHYDGAINKNSLGAVSEGARLAAELGGEAHAILLGENVPQELAASLGSYGAKKVLVAEHLGMPSLTQVIKMDVESDALRCERQAEYGYDTVQIKLPAVISVGDAINEPRYPSLKAIMGAKKKPLDTVTAGDVSIDASKVGGDNSAAQWVAAKAPPAKASGEIIEDEDTAETVEKIVAWLDERKLI